jgi:hypothetical protein
MVSLLGLHHGFHVSGGGEKKKKNRALDSALETKARLFFFWKNRALEKSCSGFRAAACLGLLAPVLMHVYGGYSFVRLVTGFGLCWLLLF